jgi:hypothetical protein
LKKKENWRSALWTTNHSPLYYFVLFLWLVMFAGGFVFLTGVPKASPIIYAYIAMMTLIWLFGFIIQIRERRGLPTLPGRDFRRNVNDGD